MRSVIILFGILIILAACSAPVEMQVQVKPLGEKVAESREGAIYFLPRTVLRVEVSYEEIRDFPGPYWEYATRYLGLEDVIRKKAIQYRISDIRITSYSENDPALAYRVHVKEGSFPSDKLDPYLQKGLIRDGSAIIQENLDFFQGKNEDMEGIVMYLDLGSQGNFGERTETMYKTIITDTSFVEVPVTRTIMEEKSLARKAEEAADFILELRTRRFEMLTGEYEVYPEGEAMASTLEKIDELEASYLSLFTGKSVSGTANKAWFVIPGGGPAPTSYNLAMFSGQLGFVPEELGEGLPLVLNVEPQDYDRELYRSFASDASADDLLFYRIPVVTDVNLTWGEKVLNKQRISVYQSGPMVTAPL